MLSLVAAHWPLLLFGLLIVGLTIAALLSLRDGPPPYERRGVLLTPPEIALLRALQHAVREDWLIFSMVRLADIIKVRPRTRKFQTWHGRIQGKLLDFVLCDPQTLDVKLAIVLDDGTLHPPTAAEQRFIAAALAAAGIPLLRIRAEEKYETAALRKDLEDALGITRKKKRA
jgi:hypothetical protein